MWWRSSMPLCSPNAGFRSRCDGRFAGSSVGSERSEAFRAGVQFVAIDPAAVYAAAMCTRGLLPNATIVVDRFHLDRHYRRRRHRPDPVSVDRQGRIRTLLSTVRVGGDPHLTRHRLHRFLAWCIDSKIPELVALPAPSTGGPRSTPSSAPASPTPAPRATTGWSNRSNAPAAASVTPPTQPAGSDSTAPANSGPQPDLQRITRSRSKSPFSSQSSTCDHSRRSGGRMGPNLQLLDS